MAKKKTSQTTTKPKRAKKPPRKRKAGELLTRNLEIREEDVDTESRSVDVSFSSETDEVSFLGVPEILLHEPDAANFESLSSVLFNHNPDRIVGRPEDVRIDEDERKGRASIVFDEDDDGERVFRKIQSGSLRGVSVGLKVSRWQILDEGESWISPGGRKFDGPVDIATSWRAVEFSLTPIPADSTVGVGRSESKNEDNKEGFRMDPKLREALLKLGMNPDASEEGALEFARQTLERREVDASDDNSDETTTRTTDGNEEDRISAALKSERERVSEIEELCGYWPETRGLAQDLIRSGATVEDARGKVLGHLRTSVPNVFAHKRVEFGEEERDKWRKCAESHLLMRVGKCDPKEMERAQEVEAHTLFDLAKEALKRSGQGTKGLSRDELIKRAISHSTSDYPNILENVSNKVLIAAYEAVPATWQPVATTVAASDFKAMSRVKLGDSGELVLTPELAPMPEATVPETKESYSIATYSKRYGISRQAIINDDLSAFDRIPTQMGQAAGRGVNRFIWDLVVSNAGVGPVMAEDSKNLIDDTHTSGSNHQTTGAAITVASVGDGMARMRKQKGFVASGENAPTLNIQPAYIVVPAAKETEALQFINSTVDPSKNNATPNPFSGRMSVIVEALLDAADANAWYLVASPMSMPGLEVAFLNGRQEPTQIRVDGTNILGVEWGVYLDFGAKFIEHRGWFKNDGA